MHAKSAPVSSGDIYGMVPAPNAVSFLLVPLPGINQPVCFEPPILEIPQSATSTCSGSNERKSTLAVLDV